MFEIDYTTKFKKDLKLVQSRGKDINKLKEVVETLAQGKKLSAKFCNHSLVGKYTGCFECHIEPDWLLIYKYQSDILVLLLSRTGTHSDLFK